LKAETTHVSGGCLCGRIRYEAEVFLKHGYICHCTLCQKSTGQPAELSVLIKPGTLKYLKAEPKYYATSEIGKRGFCAECGSRLVWQATDPEQDWTTNLSIGCLDDPSVARMTCHVYADTQLPWYTLCEDLPKFTESEAEAMLKFIKLD
jgi:hypothetical protein